MLSPVVVTELPFQTYATAVRAVNINAVAQPTP